MGETGGCSRLTAAPAQTAPAAGRGTERAALLSGKSAPLLRAAEIAGRTHEPSQLPRACELIALQVIITHQVRPDRAILRIACSGSLT